MSALITSVSGIRGIVGESLTPDIAAKFALAHGSYLQGGRVLVSRDGRPSGELLGYAVMAGLLQTGCEVVDLGIAPTPSVGVAVRAMQADGAIQITASHNPAPWNGLKLFGSDGAVLEPRAGLQVLDIFHEQKFQCQPWNQLGRLRSHAEGTRPHLEAVLQASEAEAIPQQGFKVFVDGNGGSGGPLAVELLRRLGCEVVALAAESDGDFRHEAEPTPAHLVDVAPLVAESGCGVGFVLDPDADRLALIDERGNCVSEELTLALAIRQRLREASGPVVVNLSTSKVIEDLAKQAGVCFSRSPVGEANVVQAMRAAKALIGGEGNGGVIDPRIGWVRDPFIAMGLILRLLADERKPLSQLLSELPKYAMIKTKFAVPREHLTERLNELKTQFPSAAVDERDGLRLDAPSWWLHVRPSNTEPVVRIIAEAETQDEVESIVQLAQTIIVKLA